MDLFEPLAAEFAMEWRLTDTDVRKRVMLLVSREDHCLADLLYRWRSGDLECDITSVVSNHEDLRSFVEWHEIPFHAIPVPAEAGREGRRVRGDRAHLRPRTCRRHGAGPLHADSARRRSATALSGRIINIHHSFLPSFAGSRPYHQAFARGVKLIGATCHYVTADLDEGPIIEQDTRRIDHADSPEELRRVGRDIERTVLARGLRWHLEDRVLLNGSKTDRLRLSRTPNPTSPCDVSSSFATSAAASPAALTTLARTSSVCARPGNITS